LHSEASLHPYFQIAPFADGFLVACGEVLHRCDAHGAVTGVAIVCRNLILGICIVGTQLAFSAFQGGFIGIAALDAIRWHAPHVHGFYSEAWRAAVYDSSANSWTQIISCERPRRLCELHYNNVPCVAATQTGCVIIYCVSTAACLRRVDAVLHNPFGATEKIKPALRQMGSKPSKSKRDVVDLFRAAVPEPGQHIVRRMSFLKLLTAAAFHGAKVKHAGLASLQLF
jgi:hypothetical protein